MSHLPRVEACLRSAGGIDVSVIHLYIYFQYRNKIKCTLTVVTPWLVILGGREKLFSFRLVINDLGKEFFFCVFCLFVCFFVQIPLCVGF